MSPEDHTDVSLIAKSRQTERDAVTSGSGDLSTAKTAGEVPEALEFATGRSAMCQVLAEAARVAPLTMTVLITGEPGVGKERLARWIHAHSTRADRPFVPVDCRAFPDMPVDRRLFRRPRGAFTSVVRGIFYAARGGTLFLDDIDAVSPAMQATLLRLIEERRAPPGRGVRLRRWDVRLIAATTRNLGKEMAQRRFRQDLFYCLSVRLHIPPLRERSGDLWVLARALLDRAVARRRRPIGGFAGHALIHLFSYDWPGNVRELEAAIDQASAVARGSEIQLEDLPATVRHGCISTSSQGIGHTRAARPLDDLRQSHIACVLRRHQGNRGLAAAELGMSLSTLNRRVGWRG
jgi:DNA-binding NtrC family response regulator